MSAIHRLRAGNCERVLVTFPVDLLVSINHAVVEVVCVYLAVRVVVAVLGVVQIVHEPDLRVVVSRGIVDRAIVA